MGRKTSIARGGIGNGGSAVVPQRGLQNGCKGQAAGRMGPHLGTIRYHSSAVNAAMRAHCGTRRTQGWRDILRVKIRLPPAPTSRIVACEKNLGGGLARVCSCARRLRATAWLPLAGQSGTAQGGMAQHPRLACIACDTSGWKVRVGSQCASRPNVAAVSCGPGAAHTGRWRAGGQGSSGRAAGQATPHQTKSRRSCRSVLAVPRAALPPGGRPLTGRMRPASSSSAS